MTDLGTVQRVGWRDTQRQQVAEGVDRGMQLGALLPLGPVVARPGAALGVDRKVRLSRMAALGSAARPSASRSTTRRSCAMASKQPAASQRRAWS